MTGVEVLNVIVTIAAVAVVVRFVVEGLKAAGVISARHAGTAQAWINFGLAVATFILKYFGIDLAHTDQLQRALSVAPGVLELVMFAVAVGGTKLAHEVFKSAGISVKGVE